VWELGLWVGGLRIRRRVRDVWDVWRVVCSGAKARAAGSRQTNKSRMALFIMAVGDARTETEETGDVRRVSEPLVIPSPSSAISVQDLRDDEGRIRKPPPNSPQPPSTSFFFQIPLIIQ
jgi:hypothetical protein